MIFPVWVDYSAVSQLEIQQQPSSLSDYSDLPLFDINNFVTNLNFDNVKVSPFNNSNLDNYINKLVKDFDLSKYQLNFSKHNKVLSVFSGGTDLDDNFYYNSNSNFYSVPNGSDITTESHFNLDGSIKSINPIWFHVPKEDPQSQTDQIYVTDANFNLKKDNLLTHMDAAITSAITSDVIAMNTNLCRATMFIPLSYFNQRPEMINPSPEYLIEMVRNAGLHPSTILSYNVDFDTNTGYAIVSIEEEVPF